MSERPGFILWSNRRGDLSRSMPGFDGLILALQGFLVGYSLATGEVWETSSVTDTHHLVYSLWDEIANGLSAFGVEQ